MKRTIFLCLFIILLAQVLNAEVVLLKDGSIIKGQVIKMDEKELIIKTDYDQLTIAKEKVEVIYQNDTEYEKTLSVKKSDNDNSDKIMRKQSLTKIKEEAKKIKYTYYTPGLAIAVAAPWGFLISGLATIPNGITPFLPFYALASIAFSGLATIPYGGPIAVCGASLISGITFFSMTPLYHYTDGPSMNTNPIILAWGISCIATAILEIGPIILEFIGGGLASFYKEKKMEEQKLAMFVYPSFSLKDIKEVDITAGLKFKI